MLCLLSLDRPSFRTSITTLCARLLSQVPEPRPFDEILFMGRGPFSPGAAK